MLRAYLLILANVDVMIGHMIVKWLFGADGRTIKLMLVQCGAVRLQ